MRGLVGLGGRGMGWDGCGSPLPFFLLSRPHARTSMSSEQSAVAAMPNVIRPRKDLASASATPTSTHRTRAWAAGVEGVRDGDLEACGLVFFFFFFWWLSKEKKTNVH